MHMCDDCAGDCNFCLCNECEHQDECQVGMGLDSPCIKGIGL